MLSVFRTLIYPSSGACDCYVESLHRVVLFCKDGGFSISVNYGVYWCVLVVTCFVALSKLVSVFLLILPVMVFSACDVFSCV